MNDRELDMRVREAFDTLEVPDALRQRTLEAYDELAATQVADKPELHVVSSSEAAPSRASRKVRRARLMSALAACLVLGLAVIGIFRVGTAPVGSGDSTVPVAVLSDTAVTAFVDIDINPSIELQLNDSNQVVAVEGVNEDGRSVLAAIELEGLSYEEALSALTSSEALAPYLNDDAFVQVSIASDNSGQERALMNASEQRLAIASRPAMVRKARRTASTIAAGTRHRGRADGPFAPSWFCVSYFSRQSSIRLRSARRDARRTYALPPSRGPGA